jgi:hypothetical protein
MLFKAPSHYGLSEPRLSQGKMFARFISLYEKQKEGKLVYN